MPESPDFKQIAQRMAEDVGYYSDGRGSVAAAFAQQLRHMWNALGAADIAKVEHELSTMMGSTAAGPYVKNLDRSLRALDK
jgi:hypothetical protein